MDLKGQLSNPGEKLETLVPQGSRANRESRSRVGKGSHGPAWDAESACDEEKGQHSNPPARQAQRRLRSSDVDRLVAAYLAGDLLCDIAARFGVNRTTVIGHVTRRGLTLRSNGWSDQELQTAAHMYATGQSLANVGQHFGIDPATVANRFRRAGLPIRARRGRT